MQLETFGKKYEKMLTDLTELLHTSCAWPSFARWSMPAQNVTCDSCQSSWHQLTKVTDPSQASMKVWQESVF